MVPNVPTVHNSVEGLAPQLNPNGSVFWYYAQPGDLPGNVTALLASNTVICTFLTERMLRALLK